MGEYAFLFRKVWTHLQRLDTSLPGVWELRPKVIRNSRGFFLETYHQQKFSDLGIHDVFVQDIHSRSAKGTLRGLHYQLRQPQAKLCRVVEGEVLDVAVDIRIGSPSVRTGQRENVSGTAMQMVAGMPGLSAQFCNR
jgi:dTDP-4-dehydrorhamnose 3,5-epimerase